MTTNNNNDNALTDAVSAFLTTEHTGWDAKVLACEALAKADAASDLADGAKAKAAAAVRVAVGSKAGHAVYASMTKGTYSKRVKVGRFASETCPADVVAKLGDGWAEANAASDVKLTWRDAFELACATPSLDKFYEWLPKAEHLARAKAPKAPKATPEVTPEPEATPEATPFTDDDVAKVARDLLEGLRTRGASKLQINMVITELDRLTRPVASVKAAA